MKRTLVMAGGGTKGIYEAGVLTALKELGKDDFDCVIGVSVGALNAAMIVQGDYERMMTMYDNIQSDQFINGFLPSDMNLSTLFNERQGIQDQISRYLKDKSLDVSPFYDTVDLYYDPDKFFHSYNDFMCITARKKDHSGVTVTKDMMKEHGREWLIASASAYPAFPVMEIEGEEYIDGGYYDNFPIDAALRYGSDEIVGIELNDEPLHPFYDGHRMMTIIRPHAPLYSFLDFDVFKMYKAKLLGYNDAMKAYGKYMGERYTFRPFEEPVYMNAFIRNLLILETDIKNANPINDTLRSDDPIGNKLKETMHVKTLSDRQYFFGILDSIMETVGYDDSQVYDFDEVQETLTVLFEDASRADFRFMESFAPAEIISFLKTMDHTTVIKMLVHNHFYPAHRVIPDSVMMTVYPFDYAQAELITMMIRYEKEGKHGYCEI